MFKTLRSLIWKEFIVAFEQWFCTFNNTSTNKSINFLVLNVLLASLLYELILATAHSLPREGMKWLQRVFLETELRLLCVQ